MSQKRRGNDCAHAYEIALRVEWAPEHSLTGKKRSHSVQEARAKRLHLLPSGNDKPFALVTLIFNRPLLTVGGAGGGVAAADLSSLTPTIPAPAGPAPEGFKAFP